jgi:hypothetical protein
MHPALEYLALALRDAGVVELRSCVDERWRSGLFDDIGPLRQAIRSQYADGNIYCTLNRPGPHIVATNGMDAKPLCDADIERIVRLPVDFDPVRPSGCMATDLEVAQALAARDRFVPAMCAAGWPMPLTAMSGSGAHAIWRCSIPVSAEFRDVLAVLYGGMRREFSDEEVLFDSAIRNPSRIFRLYGSVNRKGTNDPKRPWRRAECQLPAGGWQAVQLRQIEMMANRYARMPTPPERPAIILPVVGRGDYTTLDAVALMQAHGLFKRPLGGGKHAVRCPWRGEHSSEDRPMRSDSVIWEANPGEWPRFFCSHSHCEGRTMRDVIAWAGDADRFCARPYRRAA